MQIHLYQQTYPEALRLSERVLTQLGFQLHPGDDRNGLLCSSKLLPRASNFLFFDVRLRTDKHGVIISLFSSLFSGQAGSFIADPVSEELFLEVLHDLLLEQPSENPFHLTKEDYALALSY